MTSTPQLHSTWFPSTPVCDAVHACHRALARLCPTGQFSPLPPARVEEIFRAALLSLRTGSGEPPQPTIDRAVAVTSDRIAFELKDARRSATATT